MPYNYPALLPLLDDLFKIHRSKPSAEWRAQFQNYVRTMPPYYVSVSIFSITQIMSYACSQIRLGLYVTYNSLSAIA